jgi:hypothetical protein
MNISDPNAVPAPSSSTGWKTYLAAALAVGAGVLAIANGHYQEGATGIISGLALVGIRGALAKIIEAILSGK